MPVKKEIVYPIFLECCQYTEDIYWENVFEDLAYEKAPYGTYISKGFLCCSYKKKEFSYKIEKKSAETVFNEVYNLLAHKLGLASQTEKTNRRKAFSKFEESIKESRQNWNDIKKKNIRELLIELYVVRMKHKHNLSIKQSRYLASIIMVALAFKVFTSDDIDYNSGQITRIRGIDFGNKQVKVQRDLYNLDISFAPNIVLDKKLMSDNWEKYLKDLRKINAETSL